MGMKRDVLWELFGQPYEGDYGKAEIERLKRELAETKADLRRLQDRLGGLAHCDYQVQRPGGLW